MVAQAEIPCEKCKSTGMLMEEENKCPKCETKKVVEQNATI